MTNRVVEDRLTPEQEAWLRLRESIFKTDQSDEYRAKSA
jgi:hypothetical protein